MDSFCDIINVGLHEAMRHACSAWDIKCVCLYIYIYIYICIYMCNLTVLFGL
jgi:hypothetical protein